MCTWVMMGIYKRWCTGVEISFHTIEKKKILPLHKDISASVSMVYSIILCRVPGFSECNPRGTIQKINLIT